LRKTPGQIQAKLRLQPGLPETQAVTKYFGHSKRKKGGSFHISAQFHHLPQSTQQSSMHSGNIAQQRITEQVAEAREVCREEFSGNLIQAFFLA
jgi:hypothetical protein